MLRLVVNFVAIIMHNTFDFFIDLIIGAIAVSTINITITSGAGVVAIII